MSKTLTPLAKRMKTQGMSAADLVYHIRAVYEEYPAYTTVKAWAAGRKEPGVRNALRVAKVLKTTVDKLWPV